MNRIRSGGSRRRSRFVVVALAAAAIAAAMAVSLAAAQTSHLTAPAPNVRIAYLSFAVGSSYDAAMLAAAQAAAAKGGAVLTVFDAKGNSKTQVAQLQTAATSKRYDAIIVQPTSTTGLIAGVKRAIADKVKVVNLDQELGANPGTAAPQVSGLSGNVVSVPAAIGTKLGNLVIAACTAKVIDPCNAGYLYDNKASAVDIAIRNSFDKAIGSHVTVVAEGQDFGSPTKAITAAQTMVDTHPDINVIVGSDPGMEGAVQAVDTTSVTLIGYGGSEAGLMDVAAAKWYGTIMQLPATEGKLAVECAIKAIKSGTGCGGLDPAAALLSGGVVTKSIAHKFKAEWPG